MKITMRKAMLGCSLAVLLASPLRADLKGTMLAYIPFAFVVGQDVLPAGNYSISREGGFLKFASSDNLVHSAILPFAVNLAKAATGSKLIFTRYENVFFLHQVLNPVEGYGQELAKTSLERELAKGPVARTEVLLARQ